MAISTTTPIFCDNQEPNQVCYTATENLADYLNNQEQNFQLNSLLTLISMATIIFFIVAFFVYKVMVKR